MIWTAVGPEPIDPLQLLARVGSDADGAVLLFLGTVRDHADGRAVSGMTYEGYTAMATAELRAIAKHNRVRRSMIGLGYYDTHVPAIFMGWGVKHGFTDRRLSITDIAPTVCSLLQIGMPSGFTGDPIRQITER